MMIIYSLIGGMTLQIKSIKHHGALHRLWHENVILVSEANFLIGMNYNTFVTEANGKEWQTDGLALFYFPVDKWFHVIILFQDQDDYSYYCNIASPPTVSESILTYIDYDIDVIVRKDYTYEIVDEAEYMEHAEKWQYSANVKMNVQHAINELIGFINERQDPFNEEFVHYWYDRCNEKDK